MTHIRLVPYEKEKFVNRHDETDRVRAILAQMINGSSPERRTIAFMGERGIGKSWLLKHLQKSLEDEHNGHMVLFCRIDLAEYGKQDPVLAVLDILRKFKNCFSGKSDDPTGSAPAEFSRRTLEEVRLRLQEQLLVIFFDHVYEADWKLLAGLEDYLLGPLAIESGTLIILSGRGREYPWKTPELRLKAEFVTLQPLSAGDTEKQLVLQVSEAAAQKAGQIVATTGGNPLGNYLLGSEADPQAGLDAIITATLEYIPDQARRQRIRNYLEALCVLHAFDEERIPTMLAAYFGDEQYQNWGYAQTRQVRDELVQSSFARWNEERGGFVIDEMLRKSLEGYLQTDKLEIWRKLQSAAHNLYVGWSKKFARSRTIWQAEAKFHQTALQSSN